MSSSTARHGSPTPSQAKPGTPAARPAVARRWAPDDLREILAGSSQHDPRQATDRGGLTPAAAGAMLAAVTSDRLLPLLELLEPLKGSDEPSKVDQLLQLLEGIAQSQIRTEARLAGLERKLGVSRTV